VSELLQSLSDDEVVRRVGELAYAQQMMALEGLSEDDATREHARALYAELGRRGLSG
jgi:hypothetical protein